MYSSLLCGRVSNALAKSRDIRSIWDSLSYITDRSWNNEISCVLHGQLRLNPCYCWCKMLLIFRCFVIWEESICSNILDTMLVREMGSCCFDETRWFLLYRCLSPSVPHIPKLHQAFPRSRHTVVCCAAQEASAQHPWVY